MCWHSWIHQIPFFIKEEDQKGDVFDLPPTEPLSWPPIKFKPLLLGLRYAFLNGDNETPVIVSEKLTEEELAKLIAILEKHCSVPRYSTQDLREISPTLCHYRKPRDPTSSPSREPQRRFNNVMREVINLSILCCFVSGLALFKLSQRKLGGWSLKTPRAS